MTKARPNNIGKGRVFTAIDGRKVHLTIEDEIIRPQGDGKLIYLQKIRFEEDHRLEYRFTYYMLGLNGAARGRWVFGQYSLCIPSRDVRWLLREAHARAWPGF